MLALSYAARLRQQLKRRPFGRQPIELAPKSLVACAQSAQTSNCRGYDYQFRSSLAAAVLKSAYLPFNQHGHQP
jgi:hypothetical protein